jgi:hypothetical protein
MNSPFFGPLLLAFVFSFSALAEKPRPVLEVEVEQHHSRQWTKVYNSNQGWYCATEHNPMFPLKGKPASISFFQESEEEGRHCEGSYLARLEQKGKKKTWQGCVSNPAPAKFLRELGRECGRF